MEPCPYASPRQLSAATSARPEMEMRMNSPVASVEMLKAVLDAFNAHNLDRIMTFFSDDCVLEMPRGPEPWGNRYVGAVVVKDGGSNGRDRFS